MNTSKRVEELITERNITLFGLSELTGVSYSTLKSARQKGSQLTVDTIEMICIGLGITMAEFFS